MAAPDVQHEIDQAAGHHEAGRLNKAAALYRRALRREPDNARVLHALGVLAHQIGRHDAAPTLLRRAIAADSDDPRAHLDLGNHFFAHGLYAQSIPPYREAVRLAPADAAAHARLGAALARTGNWRGAAVAYARAVDLSGVAALASRIRIDPDAPPPEADDAGAGAAAGEKPAAAPDVTDAPVERPAGVPPPLPVAAVPPPPPPPEIAIEPSPAMGTPVPALLFSTVTVGGELAVAEPTDVISPDTPAGLEPAPPELTAAVAEDLAAAAAAANGVADASPAAVGLQSIRLEPLDVEPAWKFVPPPETVPVDAEQPVEAEPPEAAPSEPSVAEPDEAAAAGRDPFVVLADDGEADAAEPAGSDVVDLGQALTEWAPADWQPAEPAPDAPGPAAESPPAAVDAPPAATDDVRAPAAVDVSEPVPSDPAEHPRVAAEQATPAPPAAVEVPPAGADVAPDAAPAEPVAADVQPARMVAVEAEAVVSAEPVPPADFPQAEATADVPAAAEADAGRAADVEAAGVTSTDVRPEPPVAAERPAAWQDEAVVAELPPAAPAEAEPALASVVREPAVLPAVEPDPPQRRAKIRLTGLRPPSPPPADGDVESDEPAVVMEMGSAAAAAAGGADSDGTGEADAATADDLDYDDAGDPSDFVNAAHDEEDDADMLVLSDFEGGLDSVAAARQLRKRRKKRRPSEARHLRRHGMAMLRQRKLDEAIEAFSRLVALNPGSAKAHRDLGAAYLRDDRLEEAVASLQKALELRPKFADAYATLGDAYHLQGKLDQAITAYRQVLKLKPTAAKAHSNLLLTLNYHHRLDPRVVFEEHRRWAKQHADPLRSEIRSHRNDPSPDRRLRVGYVSPDFRRHSVNYFVEPILSSHDHQRHSIFCYSDAIRPDEVTERIAGYCDGWRDVRGMSDEEVARLIRDDRVDVLVDLSGHTGCNRMGAFARKPAPIQVTYLGYPNTTGLTTVNYRITDAHADPPGTTEHLHTEKLARMPTGTFLCYAPPPEAPPVGVPPCAEGGRVTFGCFNILAKVTPEVLALWAKILAAVPGSRLVMKDRTGSFAYPARRLHVQDIFRYHGVAADRLDLCGKEPDYGRHLENYARVDVMLDPFPYNGTTTTCEALWMGVPVVTLAGGTHVSRVGVSILSNLELPELIATTPDDYVAKAVELARDRDHLLFLRDTMRERMARSPLMDAKRFTRSLEATYRQMWSRWCGAVIAAAHSPG